MSKDPHIANIFSAEEEDCLSLEQMAAYQEGRLQGQEKHVVERHLLNCELCAMTIESLAENDVASIAAGAEEVSDRAWDRLQNRESRKRRGAIFWIASAASIALLITVGYFTFSGPSDKEIGKAFSHAMEGTPKLMPDSQSSNSIAMMEEPSLESGDKGLLGEETQRLPGDASPDPSEPVKSIVVEERLGDTRAMQAGKDDLKGSTGMGEVKRLEAPKASPAPTTNGGLSPNNDLRQPIAYSESMAKPDPNKAAKPMRKEEKGSAQDEKKSVAVTEKESSMDDYAAGDFDNEDMGSTDEQQEMLVDVVVAKSKRDNDKQAKTVERSKNTADKPTGNASVTASAPAPMAPAANYYADGISQYEQGNYKDAASNLRKATEATPGNLQAHLYAADAYLRVSQPQAALFHIERILAVPGNSNLETAEWYKALALLQLKEGRKAEKQLGIVIARNGKFKALAEEALKELK
ncbi:MAG: hypothetical protein RLZZ519_2235 [Bacteroidota bacterium]|jgi:hypothetical protein